MYERITYILATNARVEDIEEDDAEGSPGRVLVLQRGGSGSKADEALLNEHNLADYDAIIVSIERDGDKGELNVVLEGEHVNGRVLTIWIEPEESYDPWSTSFDPASGGMQEPIALSNAQAMFVQDALKALEESDPTTTK